MFICGTGSFSHQDEEDDLVESCSSPCRTPKRSKKGTSFCKKLCKGNSNKNPYAKRGLDKFYALLADLENKKQKIYTQKGSEDISFVRFAYTNTSNRIKPIVVKVKEQEKRESSGLIKPSFKNSSTSSINQAEADNKTVAAPSEVPNGELNEKPRKKRRCLRCKESFKLDNLKRPYVYFPVIVVFILLFLAMYGRSFAIMCTSIGWYVAPTVVGGSSSSPSASNERKPKRKKEYVSKQSEGPSSPKSVISGLMEIK